MDVKDLSCDRRFIKSNVTLLEEGSLFQGIPHNMVASIILGAFGLLLFSLLRKSAWDYGRAGLIDRAEKRWTSVFYGDITNPVTTQSNEEIIEDSVTRRKDKIPDSRIERVPSNVRLFCTCCFAESLSLDDSTLQIKMFQRYLIVYMAVTSAICLFIILPINVTQGDFENNSYGKTTISNIHPNSPLLWIHCLTALFLLLLSLYMMRRFAQHLQLPDDDEASRTLMVSNMPKQRAYPHLLLQHFQEAYPEASVVDIQMGYDVRLLYQYDIKRRQAADCLESSEELLAIRGQRQSMFPYICGETCCCQCCTLCGANKVDCIEYYGNELQKYNELFQKEKSKAFKQTLGIAFITFSDDLTAARVLSDFRRTCKGTYNLMTSSLSQELEADQWHVCMAPSPDGIYWHNLSLTGWKWKLLTLFYNFLILIFFIFITAPSVVLNKLNGLWNISNNPGPHPFSVVIIIILPSLILIVSYIGVPNCIALAERYLGHWSKGMVHYSCLIKIYVALTITILALPSIALSSLNAFLEWMSVQRSSQAQFRWICVLESSSSAYFVNYIITTAFISALLDLIRIPDLLLYALWNSLAKSAVERSNIRQRVLREFPYGVQYATTLFVFTVTICYSITSPVITIAGLICLINKYYVDRYNLYFGFGPSKTNQSVHRAAINISIVSVLLLQMALFLTVVLRADTLTSVNIFALAALIVTVMILCARICLGLIMPDRFFLPLPYRKISGSTGPADEDSQPKGEAYLPPVLFDNSELLVSTPSQGGPSPASQRSGGYGTIARE